MTGSDFLPHGMTEERIQTFYFYRFSGQWKQSLALLSASVYLKESLKQRTLYQFLEDKTLNYGLLKGSIEL